MRDLVHTDINLFNLNCRHSFSYFY